MNTWKPTLPPFRKYKKEIFNSVIAVSDFIYQIGEYPELRKPSRSVNISKLKTPEYKAKIKYMKKSLKKYRELTGKGRAIAAVQLGFSEAIIVVYDKDTKEESFMMINPVITKESKELFRYPEMCMSATPLIAPVIRPAWVEVAYYDEDGKKQKWITKADTDKSKMYNRILQHEIDHLIGFICIDRVSSRDIVLESDPKFYKNATFEEVK